MDWSKVKKILTICLILFFGFFLRLYKLNDYPVGFSPQESLVGYRSFLLINDSRDETGRNYPFFFTSFKDYQLPVSTYLVVPFVKVLGLNKNAVRLPFALVSSFSLLCFYLIVKHLFLDKPLVATFALLFFCVSPGNLFLSRFASENNLALNIFIIGTAFFLLSKRNWSFILGELLFVITILTSKIAWFLLPSLLLLTAISLKDKQLKRKIIISFSVVIVSLSILLINFFKLPGAKRSLIENDLNLFNNLAVSNGINSLRGQDIAAGNQSLGKFFHNKLFYLVKLSENIVQQFTPRFYFAAGDKKPLHGLSNTGPLFLFLLPLAVFGLLHEAKFNPEKIKYFLIFFIILSLPSIFILPTPDQAKSVFVYPFLIILSSIGLTKIKNKSILISLIFFILINISFIYYDGLLREPLRSQKEWAYGLEEAVKIIDKSYSEYKAVYFTDSYVSDPGPIILFFLNSFKRKGVVANNLNSIGYRQWINDLGLVKIGFSDELVYPDIGKYGIIFTPEDEKKFGQISGQVFMVRNKKICQKMIEKKPINGLDGSILLIYAENEIIKCSN